MQRAKVLAVRHPGGAELLAQASSREPASNIVSRGDPSVAEDPVISAAASFAHRHGLSSRESEIFLLFTASGKTNKEIATDLGIGYPTVKLYWTRICKKVGCECSVQAAMAFLRDALIQTGR